MKYLPKRIIISYTLPADRLYLHFLRSEVEHFFEVLDIKDDHLIFKSKLIIDELVNNAIEHGSSSESEIFIDFGIENENLIINVSDQGRGPKKKLAKEIIESIMHANENQITNVMSAKVKRGRGLTHLVRDWVDTLEILDNDMGGITIKVSKSCKIITYVE